MNSDKVARILYGDLSAKDLTKAKEKVGKILWGWGKAEAVATSTGEAGAYTFDLKFLK